MKLLALILTIAPAAGTLLLVERMGLVSLLSALFMEAACLFGLKKTGISTKMMPLNVAMEGAVLLTAAGSLCGRAGTPAELGMAALILAAVFHAAAYLTLCGFILKKAG